MRRATITIGHEIEAQLDAWMRQQEASPSLATVVKSALKEFLALRGLGAAPRKLHMLEAAGGLRKYSDHPITLVDALLAGLTRKLDIPVWTFDRRFVTMQTNVWRPATIP